MVIKKNTIRAIMALLLLIAALCGVFFAKEYAQARQEISEYAAVQSEFTSVITDNDAKSAYRHSDGAEIGSEKLDNSEQENIAKTAGLPYINADFDALTLSNPDTVGWIAIPDSPISYPVVQTKDNTKYLATSFQGKHSNAGTPFADKDNDVRNLDANTIIYGHNMGSGRQDMFGSLLEYEDYDYFDANRYIQFDSIYQRHGWWEVFAVVAYDTRSKAADFLQFRFGSADDFMAWAANIKRLSVHDAGVEISPNDKVLTLSTCDRRRYGRHGRLLVVAVKMDKQ